jgi:hypothetical protein
MRSPAKCSSVLHLAGDCLAKPWMRPFLGGVDCVPGASESIHAGALPAEVNDVSIPVPSEDILVFEKAS